MHFMTTSKSARQSPKQYLTVRLHPDLEDSSKFGEIQNFKTRGILQFWRNEYFSKADFKQKYL